MDDVVEILEDENSDLKAKVKALESRVAELEGAIGLFVEWAEEERIGLPYGPVVKAYIRMTELVRKDKP